MAAPAPNISVSALRQQFKEVYGDEFLTACPVERQIYEKFPFKKGDEPGAEFVEAIRMTEEQGFSFRKAGTTGITMQPSIALKTESVRYTGDILEFRSTVDYEAVKRGMTSKQAFKDTVGVRQEAQRDSLVKHLEWTLLNGGSPCGVISGTPAAGSGIYAGSQFRVVTLTAASYADAFWACSENMPLDIYDSTSAALSGTAVRRNTVVGGALGLFRVRAWDPDALTLTIEADTAADWSTVVSGDCLWRSTSYLNESLGMVGVCNSANQVLFNINQATYGQWRPVRDLTGGPLTMARLLRAVALIHSRSATKAEYMARVHPLQWSALNNDLAALRRLNGESYKSKQGNNGFGEIEFYSAMGTIKVVGHSFMKRGECIITDDMKWSRRGVSDIDFAMPVSTSNEPEYYIIKQDVNAVEFRAYSQQGMYCNMPSRNAYLGNLDVPA